MKPTKPWNEKRFAQEGKRFKFAFAGSKVVTLSVGGGVRLGLGDDFATQIELSMPFTFSQFGQSTRHNPGEPTTLAPLLELVGATLIKAEAADQSPLFLSFDNGMTVEAPSAPEDYQWEAWSITDRHGFHVVCQIGGDLAIWLPSAENSKRWPEA